MASHGQSQVSNCSTSLNDDESDLQELVARSPSTWIDHNICVYYHSEKKTLSKKTYKSIDELKADAFALYESSKFDDDNAILIYINRDKKPVLLSDVSDIQNNSQIKKLHIKHIHPACSMCMNPFSIIEDQLLYECPRQECGEQYCKKCVDSIRGLNNQFPFTCILCKKEITPERNLLMEIHLIWKSISKLYSVESFRDLKSESEPATCRTILNDIKFRRQHLQTWFKAFECSSQNTSTTDYFDEQLTEDVPQLITELDAITKELEYIKANMESHRILVEKCVKTYSKKLKNFDALCEILVKCIEAIETNTYDSSVDVIPSDRKTIIQEMYHMNDFSKLSSDQNIKSIDTILLDICFRKKCLLPRYEFLGNQLKNKPECKESFEKYLSQARIMSDVICSIEEQLNCLRGNLRAVERCLEKYDRCLRDEQFKTVDCSKFIMLLEQLRIRTEYFDTKIAFPRLIQLNEKWQTSYGSNNEFEPKVIDLFKAIEEDFKKLFEDHNNIYSLAYKIGIIGSGSVGKTALLMELADIDKTTFSTVDINRSTFNYLKFNTNIYHHPQTKRTIPVTFIDVQGAIDVKDSESMGNYLNLIHQVDCDLYLIAFDKAFSEYNYTCKAYAENKLRRKCILVRTQADLLIREFIEEPKNLKCNDGTSNDYALKLALRDVRRNVSIDFSRKHISDNIYVTAAGCNNDLKKSKFFTFDLNKLRKKLVQLAIEDTRIHRLWKMACTTLIETINMCFRRGYVADKTRYKWLAAACSIIPFCDEIPAFWGREEIRQNFGIHDRSTLENKCKKTTNAFEEYLGTKKFTVPANLLKSGYFQYLISKEKNQSVTNSNMNSGNYFEPTQIVTPSDSIFFTCNKKAIAGHLANAVMSRAGITLGVIANVSDDVVRAIIPIGSKALYAVSTTTIVVSVVLVPLFCAWSFYSSGKRMTEHLHLLCNDLIVIGTYFVAAICNNNIENIPSSRNLTLEDSSSDEE